MAIGVVVVQNARPEGKTVRTIVQTGAVVVALLAGVGPAAAQADPVTESIQAYIEQLSATGDLVIGEAPVAATRVVTAFYEQREFRRAWTSVDNIGELVAQIEEVYTEGLDPEDYHRTQIELMRRRVSRAPNNPELRAGLDILLTESLVRLAYHLNFGKVDPNDLDTNWNLARDLKGRDPVAVLGEAISSESLDEFISLAIPRLTLYRTLTGALAAYRMVADTGGWPAVPEGPVLKPGMKGPRVQTLRMRLSRSGDLTDRTADDVEFFDEKLEEAVIRFQGRHGLDADGVVGKATLAALNVTARERVDQIRVNLERARWVMRDLPSDEFLVTNIAGFSAFFYRDEDLVWDARAQVGKPYRKTPVFKAELEYLVFNPTWTVPPTILKNDVLPAIQRDIGYLKSKNMVVLDRSGKKVDPTTIDWAAYKGRGFPYVIRQEPGPNNALGRVKFIFPNEHFVFLHDTPSRGLFDRAKRTFSSGCIRVDRPLELAELVLDDPEKWNRETIQEVLDGKKTRTVHLQEPMPVLLLYWTAFVDDDGVVNFLEDVYDRDQRILDGLEGEFKISVPTGAPDYLTD
jgi:murein L,D-transpeptidase YcbB/YkuD